MTQEACELILANHISKDSYDNVQFTLKYATVYHIIEAIDDVEFRCALILN